MKKELWAYIIIVIILALIGSVFVVSFVLGRHHRRNAELGISNSGEKTASAATAQGRKWNRIICIYLLLCFVTTIIILYQSGRTTNRMAVDCLAVPVGALFFLIEAFSLRNIAIKRERATTPVTATYVMSEVLTSTDSRRSYYSIFQFSVKDKTYRVRYHGKPKIEKGAPIELYYAPDDPNIIYVPELRQSKGWIFSAILLIYGCIFPIFALLAPFFR